MAPMPSSRAYSIFSVGPQEANEFAQYAVRLTPVYPAEFPAVLAACYLDSGRYADAVDAAEMSLRLRDDAALF
jgi:hypothetical protein